MSRLLRTCATSVNLADASRPSHRAGCASPGWPSAPDRSPTPRAIVVSCRVVSCRVVKFDPWTGLESRQETGREHRTAASSHGRMDAWTHGRMDATFIAALRRYPRIRGGRLAAFPRTATITETTMIPASSAG